MWRAYFSKQQVHCPDTVLRATSHVRHRTLPARHRLSFICAFPIRSRGTALAGLCLMARRAARRAVSRAFLQDVQLPGCPSCPDSLPRRRRIVDISMRRSAPSRDASLGGDSRSEGRWRGRRLVGECVGALLIVSVALAYASPPDPSWISGIYDAADYDDVVGMVTDATGANDSQATQQMGEDLEGPIPGAAARRFGNPAADRWTIRGPPTPDASIGLLLTPPGGFPRLSHICVTHAQPTAAAHRHSERALQASSHGSGARSICPA